MTGQAAKTERGGAAPFALFAEAPAFADLHEYALSYAFELEAAGPRRCTAFRLAGLDRDLDPAVHEALIGPVRSYHDDVTIGPPGRGGRPLIFSATAPDEDPARRAVDFVRPGRWSYAAENRRVEMVAGDGKERRVAFEYRDYFCAFGSGRLFYVLSFFPRPGADAALDEYSLIWLEKLAVGAPERDAYAAAARFEHEGRGLGLADFAQDRLGRLASADAPTPNGQREIVLEHLMRGGTRPLGPDSVRSLVIGIDDQTLFDAACFVETLEIEDFEAEPRAAGGTRAHSPLEFGADIRRSLALAGILQSVPDFPLQDRSEIWDSTRSLVKGDDFYIFGHPRFTVAIGIDWRTLAEARACLGHCPYLSLMWLVAVHDEIIVGAIEARIETLIYGEDRKDGHCAEPLADLRRLLGGVSNPLKRGATRILRENIVGRFELFRELSINQSSRMLRYDKEADALEALKKGMGTVDRYRRAHDLLDRLESIVEDAHELNRTYSGRLMNSLLAAIALSGIVGVVAELSSAADLGRVLWTSAALLAGLVAAAVLVARLRD